jgi:RNA polymerase primary sigma factor
MAQRPSEAEIRGLVLAAKSGKDQAARQLIVALSPAIRRVARGYCRWRTLEEAELIQEGIVGLLRAVERFDAAVDTPFWAYAGWWVRQCMQRLVAELTGPVVLSDRAMRQLARVKAARREHIRSHGTEPTSRDLAALTGMPTDQVDDLIHVERRPRGLEQPVGDGTGSGMTFEDLVSDPRAEDAFEQVPMALESQRLSWLLDHLNERERTVVRARFGLGHAERTLREVGAALNVSAERVRQIQEEALAKLRAVATH